MKQIVYKVRNKCDGGLDHIGTNFATSFVGINTPNVGQDWFLCKEHVKQLIGQLEDILKLDEEKLREKANHIIDQMISDKDMQESNDGAIKVDGVYYENRQEYISANFGSVEEFLEETGNE